MSPLVGSAVSTAVERLQRAADAVNDLGTVMIVEDEAIIAMSLEEGLSDEGFRVVGPFSACAEALAFLEAEIPQCAILDAQLSDGTCLELARELQRREVPFLIYSGVGGFEARAPELRGVTWIEKPAPVDVVVEATRRLRRAGATRGGRPCTESSGWRTRI